MSSRLEAEITMKLYQTPGFGRGSGASLQVVAFEAGGIRLAVDIAEVTSIVMPQAPVVSQHLPAYVVGAITVRGQAVPILDLRARFGLPRSGKPRMDCERIVVVRSAKVGAGFVVDAVSEIAWMKLFTPDIESDRAHGIDRVYLRGIGFKGNSAGDAKYPVAVLEVGRILRACADSLQAARASLEMATYPKSFEKVVRRSRRAA
jgi:purine-binding chemotaxis protein CheW